MSTADLDLLAHHVAEPVDLFRIVKGSTRSAPAVLDSLRSNYERDAPPRGLERELVLIHLGLSMFESEELAEASATNFPKFITSVRLEPDRGFMLARTESEIEGHFSVWGDPESLLDSVEGPVTRVDEPG